MLHTRHTSAFHAAAPRLEIWMQVVTVVAVLMAERLAKAWRRA